MTASVLKQDAEKEMFFSRKIQCRLCVCVVINKRSFEPFMSFELQGCFECTDWNVFVCSTAYICELSDYVTGYMNFCEKSVMPKKTIKLYSVSKP